MRENATTSRARCATGRRGATLVWVAILLLVFIGMLGLALDWGYAFWTAQKLQNGADAAALAGVRRVWWNHGDARERAIEMAALNEAGGAAIQLEDNPSNNPDGDIVIGRYDEATRMLTPTLELTEANAVMVRARRTASSLNGALPLIFGRIFGVTDAEITRWGIAVASGGPTYADIIALNETERQSLYIYGNGHLDLGEDGTAQVNSRHSGAATYQGSSITFIYDEVNIVGSWNERGNPEIPEDSQDPGEPLVPDPLAGLPEPIPGDPMSPSVIAGSAEYQPGYYPGGLYLNNDETAFLHPGVYILDGGFHTNGHCSLTGEGVMIFIRSGELDHNGTGEMRLTPPADGTYKGIQFFQARDNTEEAHFNGTGLFTGADADDPSTPDVDESTAGAGTLYFPNATVHLNGTGDMYFNGLIADKIHVGGDGTKVVTSGWDGDKGGDKVWLVE